jgi:hypothetical protein
VGWRNIIEKMHMTSTLTKWYDEHGRHEIFAGGKAVGLAEGSHKLRLNEDHVQAERNHTLDDLGIAKTAREEKLRARDEKIKKSADDARMESLYREHILKEPKAQGGFVPLGAITSNGNGAKAEAAKKKEEVFGD